ncbi:MAG TPA: TRAFs-binding domain-containing protein, partial [Chloroflexota bacterium]
MMIDAPRGVSDQDSRDALGPQEYGGQAKTLIQSGHSARAFELCREGLERYPGEPSIEFYEALALARGGNPSRANQSVIHLLARTDLSMALRVEVLSLAGRLAKDRVRSATTPALRRRYAREAARWYQQAYELSHDIFPGVNAATLLVVGGRVREAHQIAGEVVRQGTRDVAASPRDGDYWLFASLGEASLVLGQPLQALDWYRQAVELASGRLGEIASMRRNLLLLADQIAVPDDLLALVRVGSVVAFSGHMVDHPFRVASGLPERFPASAKLEKALGAAIASELQRLNVVVGFSSAASGSDIIFAEQMLARGAELHIVLPFHLDDFYCTSVDFGLDQMSSWRERCDRVLASAADIHYATQEHFLGDESLFEFANTLMAGLAVLRARELEAEPHALAVVEAGAETHARQRTGGAAQFLQSWQKSARSAQIIDLAPLREQVASPPNRGDGVPDETARQPLRGNGRRRIKAMFFADVKGFSKLDEEQAPAFFEHFLSEVARLIANVDEKPIFQNTWGDGLFLVFNGAVPCAEFASSLLQ